MKLNGREIADQIYHDLQQRVGELKKKNIIPHLVVLLIGNPPTSEAYINQKQRIGERIGAKVTVLRYSESITTEELEEKITLLNQDPFVHGILLQRPVPTHIAINKLALLTNPQKDIDGFHPDSPYILPLPLAVEKILQEVSQTSGRDEFLTWLKSKNVVLIGKGETGGQPIYVYLTQLGITPHQIDSKTQTAEQLIEQADIIISAVGKKIITPSSLKKGVILIGVGLFKGPDGTMQGDYDEEEIKAIASFYTPTPGGVGPVNVAMLMKNLLTATEKQISL